MDDDIVCLGPVDGSRTCTVLFGNFWTGLGRVDGLAPGNDGRRDYIAGQIPILTSLVFPHI